jgi:hypothetical protein
MNCSASISSAGRIVAEGQGVGYMFEEPDWNRVSICTINTRPDAAEGK